METPNDGPIKAGVQLWWTRYRTTEHHVRNDDAAYKKLQFVQGTLIPWFYGSHLVSLIIIKVYQLQLTHHQFTLPDGHQVYGILMELARRSPLALALSGLFQLHNKNSWCVAFALSSPLVVFTTRAL